MFLRRSSFKWNKDKGKECNTNDNTKETDTDKQQQATTTVVKEKERRGIFSGKKKAVVVGEKALESSAEPPGSSPKNAPSNSCNSDENSNEREDFSQRKAELTPLEYRVTQQKETERPYSNKYNRHFASGSYHCIICATELFRSSTKFESNSGWPAFSSVVDPSFVNLKQDTSHFGANLLLLIVKPDSVRTAVSCAKCGAHLGHLFKDGPKPTGLRYCINSSSLSFIPTTLDNDNNDAGTSSLVPTSKSVETFQCDPQNTCAPIFKEVSSIHSQSAKPDQAKASCQKSKSKTVAYLPSATLCLREGPPPGPIPSLSKQSKEYFLQRKEEQERSAPSTNISGSEIFAKCNSSKPKPPTSLDFRTRSGDNLNPPFVRSSFRNSGRFENSKGASLTQARIEFFQKLADKDKDSSNSEFPAFNSRKIDAKIVGINSKNFGNGCMTTTVSTPVSCSGISFLERVSSAPQVHSLNLNLKETEL